MEVDFNENPYKVMLDINILGFTGGYYEAVQNEQRRKGIFAKI